MTAVPPLDREALIEAATEVLRNGAPLGYLASLRLAAATVDALAPLLAARESALSAQHQQELADAEQRGREKAAQAIEAAANDDDPASARTYEAIYGKPPSPVQFLMLAVSLARGDGERHYSDWIARGERES